MSLVPSQTELLFALGAGSQVTGITKFCTEPAVARRQCTRVGGTKHPDIGLIRTLRPDIILGNKEENDKSSILALRAEFPVWLSNVITLEDNFNLIRSAGEIVNRSAEASQLEGAIRHQWLALPQIPPQRVAYLIWAEPFMLAGSGTFINSVLQALGLKNVAPAPRYPEVSRKQLAALAPDLVMLSSEPYPFSEKHVAEMRSVCPAARMLLVDGKMFSWYGSHLLTAPAYFATLFQQ